MFLNTIERQTDSNYNSCTKRCCDDSVVYSPNQEGINKCQEYLDSKQAKINNIVNGVFLGVFFLIFAFYLILILK